MEQLNKNLLNQFIKDLYSESKLDMEIDSGISIFMNYIKATKRIATYNFYKNVLKDIVNFIHAEKIQTFNNLNTDIIIKYINLKSKSIKNITINKRIGALRFVIAYLEQQELISITNIKLFKLKETKPKIEIVTNEDLKKILNHIKSKNIQNQLAFFLMITTGIRRTEITFIKNSNINLIAKTIYLDRTKTGTPRMIFLTDEVIELIKKTDLANEFLLTNENGVKLGTSFIDSVFYRIKKELNILMLSPHKLRHTYATMLLENGADIESVRLLLGHESYEMTKRYLHVKNERLKDTSISFNPLAKL